MPTDMKIQEVNKIIEEYPAKTALELSIKDNFRMIAKNAYEAGLEDGMNKVIEIQGKVMEEKSF